MTFLLYRKFNRKCESIDAIARSDWIEQYNPTVEELAVGISRIGQHQKTTATVRKGKNVEKSVDF